MLTADHRKELEAIVAEMRIRAKIIRSRSMFDWADRIAAVLADGVKQT